MILKPSEKLLDAIKKYQSGDQSAFDTIYYESIKYVCKSVLNVLNRTAPEASDDLQQDIIQDTYLTIASKLDTLKEPEAFLQWAGQIATRHAQRTWNKDVHRHQMEHPEDDMLCELVDEEFIPEEILYSKEKQKLIRQMLDELPTNQYLCVVEYFYNGLREKEVAEKLGMPVNTVKTNLSRAKKKLKDIVQTTEKKQGIRLYSMSWLLILLFWEDIKAMAVPAVADTAVLEAVHAQTAAEVTGTVTAVAAESVGTAAAGAGIAAKIAAGILAAVVTVGGVVGGVLIKSGSDSNGTDSGYTTTIDKNEYSETNDFTETTPQDSVSPTGGLRWLLSDIDGNSLAHSVYIVGKHSGSQQVKDYPGGMGAVINLDASEEYTLTFRAEGYQDLSLDAVVTENEVIDFGILYVLPGETSPLDNQPITVTRITQREEYNSGTLEYSYEYRYNENGQLTSERCFGSDGSEEYTRSITYDLAGRMREQIQTGNQNNFWIRYEYQNGGSTVIESYMDMTGEEVRYTFSNMYDSEGRLVLRTLEQDDMSLHQTKYTYDENGRLIQLKEITLDGRDSTDFIYLYTYNDNGHLITTQEFKGADTLSAIFVRKTTCSYDDSGRLLSEITYDETGDITAQKKWSHSDEKSICQYTDIGIVGTLVYNINGDLIEEDIIDHKTVRKMTYEYTYSQMEILYKFATEEDIQST